MAPFKGEIGRHQGAEGRERMFQRLRNQRVRGHDERSTSFSRMNWNGIFLRIERLLSFHRLSQFVVSFGEWNGANPGQSKYSLLRNTLHAGRGRRQ